MKADRLTAKDFLRKLKLRKHIVRDDGRCWLYVVMAKLNMYKASLKRGNAKANDPCYNERVVSQAICAVLDKEIPGIAKEPDYDGKRAPDDFFGTYGGTFEWQALCEMFDIAVVLWDPGNTKKMTNANELFPFVRRINDKGILRMQTVQQIKDTIDALPFSTNIVHVAWSNTIKSHFDVYL